MHRRRHEKFRVKGGLRGLLADEAISAQKDAVWQRGLRTRRWVEDAMPPRSRPLCVKSNHGVKRGSDMEIYENVWTEMEIVAALQAMLQSVKDTGKTTKSLGGQKIHEENIEVMRQIAETTVVVSDILHDALSGEKSLSAACRERKMDYVRFRRFCEKFLQVRDGGKQKIVFRSYDPTFEEWLYARVYGVSAEDAQNIMPDDAEERVEKIMASLDAKSRDIITRRANKESFKSIGESYGVCRERIRQKESQILRIIRGRLRAMDKDAKSYMDHVDILDIDTNRNDWLGKPIEDLDLSFRSYHCLSLSGIDTVGNLIEWDIASLRRIRNFGSKSLAEVVNRVHQLGLSFHDEGAEA